MQKWISNSAKYGKALLHNMMQQTDIPVLES